MKKTSFGILAFAFCTVAQAVPINVDFGPNVTFIPNLGPIDAGVNVIRAGNFTASSNTVTSSVTFSVPVGVQVDQITVEFLSYQSLAGGLLSASVLSPNSGSGGFGSFPALNVELGFQNLAITNSSAVTTSFQVIQSSAAGSGVMHYYALRIYASNIPSNAPDSGTTVLMLAGALLALAAGQRRLKLAR
jgi:hypothetical protein